MKNLVTIGLPSKGRLKEKAVTFFEDKGLKIIQSDKERNYFAKIENKSNIKIIYLHAKEIIQRLGDGTLDIGISGLDLLNESEKNNFSNLYKLLKNLNNPYENDIHSVFKKMPSEEEKIHETFCGT